MNQSSSCVCRDVEVVGQVRFRDTGGEAVLLNCETGGCYTLDCVSARMWALLTATGSKAATLQALLLESDLSPVQLRRDMDAFVRRMETHNLLRLTA